MVRLEPDQFEALDAWIEKQDEPFTRPEAIRRLVELGLKARKGWRAMRAKFVIACLVLTMALTTAALSPARAETCSLAVVHCKQRAIRQSDREEKCGAAGAQCMLTGTFIGPYTAKTIHGFTKR
jgi:hypothetical protein